MASACSMLILAFSQIQSPRTPNMAVDLFPSIGQMSDTFLNVNAFEKTWIKTISLFVHMIQDVRNRVGKPRGGYCSRMVALPSSAAR